MSNGITRITEALSAPMEGMIVALGVSIAQAQRELDRYSLDMQREIDEDPVLAELGLQATWYQFPHTELELTMAVSMEEESDQAPRDAAFVPAAAARALQPYALRSMQVAPVNARYKNQFNFDVQASSKLKLTIVPVPPPTADAAVTPVLTREKVLETAGPSLAADSAARIVVNFNGQARLWYVLQYRITDGATERLALVVVDDDSGQVVKAVKG